MELLFITLSYFGGLLIPLLYFLFTRLRGVCLKPMLLGFLLQIFWTACVWQYTLYCKNTGYREWYWNWALLYPVNFISIIYYAGAYAWIKKKHRASKT